MVTTKESNEYQQIFNWESSDLDQMALLQSKQSYTLPWIQPLSLTGKFALPGQSVSELPGSNCEQLAAVARFSKPVPLYLTGAPYLQDQHAVSHEHVLTSKANDTSGAPQRRFLVFDQSGNRMKMFFCPSPSNQIGGVAAQVDYKTSMEPVAEETWDENHLLDEVDIPEDSDEIDALLYSDDDDDDGGNDEVMNSGCSRFIIGEGNDKDKSPEECTEEVVNSDDQLLKRQRLLDGQYKKPSLASLHDDVKPSCAGDCNSISSLKKVKVHQTLKALESIIPGLTSNDPLSIIDKAIIYLKSMKTEAEGLGLSFPDCTSSHTPAAGGRAESLHQWASQNH